MVLRLVVLLLAFTFFMGLMLSRMIGMVLGFKNGTDLIMTAFAGTAGVFFVMASLASVIKRDLSGMGKWLFVGAMVLMACLVAEHLLISSEMDRRTVGLLARIASDDPTSLIGLPLIALCRMLRAFGLEPLASHPEIEP